MGRAREREEAGRLDLEILDPVTGESVDPDAAPADRTARQAEPARRTRLRRTALVLAVLSVASALGAGVRGADVRSLEALNVAWADAMALDRARQQADDDLRAAVERTGGATGRERDDAYRDALGAIGAEVSKGLLATDQQLLRQRIRDDWIAEVRTAMVTALQFRRRQLSVERGLLGSTPLQRADAALRTQLERFDLDAATVPQPALRSAEVAIEDLRRFAPVDTETLLVASSGRRLLYVDVDASAVDDRTLPHPPERLFGVGNLVVVTDGSKVTAYPARPDRPARWSVPGTSAVAGREGTTTAVWVTGPGSARAVGPEGMVGDAVPLPPGTTLLADTDGGLLVGDGEALRLHDHVTGELRREVSTAGRFVGATAGFVAVQVPGRPALVLHRLSDGSDVTLDLPRTDAGPIVQAAAQAELAFAAGPLAGNIASVLRLGFVGNEWRLVGVGGPRATTGERRIVWSPSGRDLFWLTPDGRIAMASDRVGPALLRAPACDLDQLVALTSRR